MSDPELAISAGARLLLALLGTLALHCSSSDSGAQNGACFPDSDGVTGGSYTIDLTVADDGFSKLIVNTQNNSTVTLTLKNAGTLPHGFEVECASVLDAFPNLPAGCPSMSCFPAASTIAPIAPGETATVTFGTPTTDDVIYPFRSNAPEDAAVAALNDGQWSLM